MLKSDVLKPGSLKGMVISEIYKPDTFLFYSYGSNILTFRMHMHCPSAEFVAIGRIDNYRLDFIKYQKFWGGPTPTIVPTANAHVWGVIWRIHMDDLPQLDVYVGLEHKRYFVTHIFVSTCHMGQFRCRVYISRTNPLPRGNRDRVPLERWPSRSLRKVMLLGAIEHSFPRYYIYSLWRKKHNGERGLFEQECLLRRYAAGPVCECTDVGERILRRLLKKELPSYQKTLKARERKKRDKDNKQKEKEEEEQKEESKTGKLKLKRPKIQF